MASNPKPGIAAPPGLTPDVLGAIVEVVVSDPECKRRIDKHSWLHWVVNPLGSLNPLSSTPYGAFMSAGNVRNTAIIVKNAIENGQNTGNYWPSNPDDTPRGDTYLCYAIAEATSAAINQALTSRKCPAVLKSSVQQAGSYSCNLFPHAATGIRFTRDLRRPGTIHPWDIILDWWLFLDLGNPSIFLHPNMFDWYSGQMSYHYFLALHKLARPSYRPPGFDKPMP